MHVYTSEVNVTGVTVAPSLVADWTSRLVLLPCCAAADTPLEGSSGGGPRGHGKKLGTFIELFVFEPGEESGQYLISKQELYVQK